MAGASAPCTASAMSTARPACSSRRPTPGTPRARPTSGRGRRPRRPRSARSSGTRRSSSRRRWPAVAWSRSCAGKPVSGRAWYRISKINGTSVRSLYGVSYLYAPAGLFTTAAAAAPATPPDAPHYAAHRSRHAPAAPITGSTVTVSSIPALLSALANDSVGLIVVANGTYHVSPSGGAAPDALGIGCRFAARTRPVTVRPRPAAA